MRRAEAAPPYDEDGVYADCEAEKHTNGPWFSTQSSEVSGSASLLQLLHTFQGTHCPSASQFSL